MDDAQFRKLLDFLGYSWPGYRRVRKGVKKRILRHMQQLGCRNIAAYLDQLESRAALRYECELLMTVSISRFFRDRRLWCNLENQWVPEIISRNPLHIDVWSAGCACGEEVYSFKIIWQRLITRVERPPSLKILATDRHPHYIKRARRGIYSRSSVREVAADMRPDFFECDQNLKQFKIKNQFKDKIRWEIGDLTTESPNSMFHIIFLRNNILTYCRRALQIRAFKQILDNLAPGGLFITGCHESLPFETGALAPMSDCQYVYLKK